MSEEEKIKYRDAFPKDYDLPTYFTGKHAISMHLRDYFAAKAMQADMSTYSSDLIYEKAEWFEARAVKWYEVADAMLKVREQ